MVTETPDFRSPAFLQEHAQSILAFYHPRCIDPDGGFFQFFKDDGHIYDRSTRHLVSSSRFVFNYAMACTELGESELLAWVSHGLDFLRERHRNPDTGGYAWTLDGPTVTDDTNYCYGLAFVALAYAVAYRAGVPEARGYLDETWALMEAHFWDARFGLYRDEATVDWEVSAYRGQNANMHTCEAWLMAYEATGEPRYLERAAVLADNMTNRQAALANGLVWEHYHTDWTVDWDYNRGDFSNIFKPWGIQPGHQTEWAKLLLILDAHRPEAWHLERARALFDWSVEHAWDAQHGGLVYGLDPNGGFYDTDKYFWVQAESLAAAARLAVRTGDAGYWAWYDRLWGYAWKHLVDPLHGGWYRILSRTNAPYSDEKSPAGKTGYHTMGACYDVLRATRTD